MPRLLFVTCLTGIVFVAGSLCEQAYGSQKTAHSGAASRSLYVSPTGDDANTGESPDKALKSPRAALAAVTPGTIVYFDAGTYTPLKISDKHGTADAPIVFRSLPGKERLATFSSGKLEAGGAIEIEQSSFLEIRDLRAADSQKGISAVSVTHSVIEGNLVENLGQEAIHVGRKHSHDGSKQFLAPASEDVRVAGNTIRGTGKVAPEYGEAVYIGTGAFLGDDTHGIVIEGNTLTDIAAEGIEVKPGTYDVTIRRNAISNTHHEYNGAITVSVEGTPTQDGKFLIEDNLIWGIKKVKHGVAGIAIGHGNAVIRNNIIWDIEGGVGISVYATFANPKALSVTIANNTICASTGKPRIVLHEGTGGGEPSPLRADVKILKTFTDDGSSNTIVAQPGLFVGPFTGSADAGKGPGSGFRLKRYAGVGADYTKIITVPKAKPTSSVKTSLKP